MFLIFLVNLGFLAGLGYAGASFPVILIAALWCAVSYLLALIYLLPKI